MTTDRTATANWKFTDFGQEFDTHVSAHLPGYADVQNLIGLIASHVVPDGGLIVDLGASTGRSIQSIRQRIPEREMRAILYDNDQSMLDVAATRLNGTGPTEYRHQDLTSPEPLPHDGADLTLALWVLQFLPPAERLPLLTRARAGAAPGGSVIIAAKTEHHDVLWERIAVAALDDYKDAQGVEAKERAAKTRALRGALHTQPETQIHAELLRSGWTAPTVLWRWHVWTVMAAHA